MTKTFKDKPLFRFSNFDHWDLFDIWNLVFRISINNDQQNKSPQGITEAELFGFGFFTLSFFKSS
jgi:hypothetical protein